MEKKKGRPRKAEGEKGFPVFVYLYPELLEEVDRRAKGMKIARSLFLRNIIEEKLKVGEK